MSVWYRSEPKIDRSYFRVSSVATLGCGAFGDFATNNFAMPTRTEKNAKKDKTRKNRKPRDEASDAAESGNENEGDDAAGDVPGANDVPATAFPPLATVTVPRDGQDKAIEKA